MAVRIRTANRVTGTAPFTKCLFLQRTRQPFKKIFGAKVSRSERSERSSFYNITQGRTSNGGVMTTMKKGVLTSPPIWARHLRPWGKRLFWKMERKAAKRIRREFEIAESVRRSPETPPASMRTPRPGTERQAASD